MSRLSLQRKLKSALVVTIGSIGAFGAINIYKNNERFYKEILIPLVHYVDPEKAHKLAIFVSKYRLIPKNQYEDNGLLMTYLFDRKLSNPIGLAAGFDKHAEAIVGLHDMGFGFVEIGSVTPLPQAGNEKPRVFRLPEDYALINRYGFNSVGHDKVCKRLDHIRTKLNFNYTIGVNLGKNKISKDPINDYVEGIIKFGPFSDYLVINISSPNTPGLRNLQTKVALKELLKAIVMTRNSLPHNQKPHLLLKLAPDLTYEEQKDIAEVLKLKECKIDGLIISNTTVARPRTLQNVTTTAETGGLSGKPLKDMSTQMIGDMYKLTGGMTIIGVGGIFNGQDAYDKIKAGASAVQLYTGLVYEGPPIVAKVKRELADLLVADGYRNVTEAVGKNIKL